VFAASLAPTAVRADDITYAVDLTFDGDTLMGTISTNGTLGPLTAADISSYSLYDTENFLTTTLTQSNSSFTSGPNPTTITATATQLITNGTGTNFNIDGPGGEIFFINNVSGVNTVVLNNTGNDTNANDNFRAGLIIASVQSTSVPELNPSSGGMRLTLNHKERI
jgi:hypothetical protein